MEQTGIRFTTLADEPGPESEQKLYTVYARSFVDVPGFDAPACKPFPIWRREELEGAHCRRDLIFMAKHGETYAGITTMYPRSEALMYTPYTGVLPEYRGRQIALALKLLSVRAARRHGATVLRTTNDATNAPMIAANRRLGFVYIPSFCTLRKEL